MRLKRSYRRFFYLPAILVVICLPIAACSSTPRQARPRPDGHTAAAPVEQRLRQAAHDWEGTPHRIGGLDRSGIDCSGLVVRIYADLFDHQLPRTTGALARAGRSAGRRALRPGDLVLFRIPDRKQHVGIFLGREEFVHASASRGVMISRLDESYWRRAFRTARRILD